MGEKKKEKNEVNFAKAILYAEMAKQLENLKTEAKREIEVKRERKAEEKKQQLVELERKPLFKRFGNAKKVRVVEARRLELEKKELKKAKRAEHRARSEAKKAENRAEKNKRKQSKKGEKTCNRVHVPRIAA